MNNIVAALIHQQFLTYLNIKQTSHKELSVRYSREILFCNFISAKEQCIFGLNFFPLSLTVLEIIHGKEEFAYLSRSGFTIKWNSVRKKLQCTRLDLLYLHTKPHNSLRYKWLTPFLKRLQIPAAKYRSNSLRVLFHRNYLLLVLQSCRVPNEWFM